jgi:putative glutathione S-transferase
VLLGRALLGLEDAITVDVLFPSRSTDDEPLGPNLWKFAPMGALGINGRQTSLPECTADTVNGKSYIKQVYEQGGVFDQKSVPILWDKQTQTVVNNESAEILRMMGTVMQSAATRPLDLYPEALRTEIDEWNDWVYVNLANGSYKAGFSSNQDVYEKAYANYFAALTKLNERLADNRFLVGDNLTEADVRLFPPLFRHDPVYYNRFKLNQSYLWEYPHIWRWVGDMMQQPGMEPVSNASYLQHCKQGYFGRTGNGTVPIGPPGYPECQKKPHWSHTK